MLGIAAGGAGLIAVLGASPGGESPAAPALKTLSPADMDTKAEACTDFWQYSVGTWLEKNPIPSDRPRWGTFDELRQRTQDNLHRILERLAADKSAKSGSDERKLGDFYGACALRNSHNVNALSVRPIMPCLHTG